MDCFENKNQIEMVSRLQNLQSTFPNPIASFEWKKKIKEKQKQLYTKHYKTLHKFNIFFVYVFVRSLHFTEVKKKKKNYHIFFLVYKSLESISLGSGVLSLFKMWIFFFLYFLFVLFCFMFVLMWIFLTIIIFCKNTHS